MRTVLICIAGWLAAVVVATAVGFAAISLVGGDVGAPVTGISVVAAASPTPEPTRTTRAGDASSEPRERTPSAEPGGGGSSSSSATQVTDAGSVTARCRSGGARLVSWSPQNDWSVLTIGREGTSRQVVFTDGTTAVTVDVRCLDGDPTFSVSTAAVTPEPSETPTVEPSPTDSVAPDDTARP